MRYGIKECEVGLALRRGRCGTLLFVGRMHQRRVMCFGAVLSGCCQGWVDRFVLFFSQWGRCVSH